jgi:outer membrane protein assembly factor BamD (BamD/ComL family)
MMTISSRAEYEAAIRRIRELGDLPEGTPGAETELTTLVELTTAWEEDNEAQARPEPTPPSRDRGTL